MNFAVQTFISLARNSFKEKYEGLIFFSAKLDKSYQNNSEKNPAYGRHQISQRVRIK